MRLASKKYVNAKWLEGKRIKVKDYLMQVLNDELPLVNEIYIENKEITLEELFKHHLDEEAIFFNNEKYEYDDESSWSINDYELILNF